MGTTDMLDGGFADPIFAAQGVFRAVMDAMARPGSRRRVAALTAPPAPMSHLAGAVALALCDHDTPVWLDRHLSTPLVREWLGFHSGAAVTPIATEAHFAFPAAADDLVALESFAQGGWLGKGPGEGTVKRILPDAHTDFIFAVTAEEFGIVVCMLLVALFAIIVIRALFVAQKAEDPFIRLAVTGLALLFGIQAAINMMVNLHMMPAKGMTLPFISYGGSSLLSLAVGTGFLLALTRRRPRSADFGR